MYNICYIILLKLEEAGLREVEEETGLTVAKAQYGEGLVLGLWEVRI